MSWSPPPVYRSRLFTSTLIAAIAVRIATKPNPLGSRPTELRPPDHKYRLRTWLNYMKSGYSVFAISGRDQLPAHSDPYAPGDNQSSTNPRNPLSTESVRWVLEQERPPAAEAAEFQRRPGTTPSPPEKTTSDRHRIPFGIVHTDVPARGPQDRGLASRRPAGFPSETPDPSPYDRDAFTHLSYTHSTTICPLSQ
jgi:hypothetical protein